MTSITVEVTGAHAQASLSGLLTSGMVGVPVTFLFDESWEGLIKTALFRAGGTTVGVHEMQGLVKLPWEVLEKQNCTLYVGVCGMSEDGTLVIPTVWAQVGTIAPGADPDATAGADPTLPVWKRALDIARSAEAVAMDVYTDAQAGVFDGYSPVRGTDYWTDADIAEIRGYVDAAILGGKW